ncbi:MAG: lamin tail domain-containing protein [candidate division Zixibacteria bacterium]
MRSERLILTLLVELLVLQMAPSVFSTIVINEVMSNEPGSSTSLEWIELYNNSASQAFINSHTLVVGSDTVLFSPTLRLAPFEYYIICRKLIGDAFSPGFETRWGDSSGFWGDTPFESSIQIPQPAAISLLNSGGTIRLYDAFNILVSEFVWSSSGKDGTSWERTFADLSQIEQSVDPSGSTAALVNSVSPLANDLSIEKVEVFSINSATSITVHILNRSFSTISGASLYLFRESADTSQPPVDTIDIINLPDALPGFTTLIKRTYFLTGLYENLRVKLPDDDRLYNNQISFIAPGSEFPPLIINEFLPDPKAPLATEWVELKNISSLDIDLNGWQIGDVNSVKLITSNQISVSSGEYVVLAQDSLEFTSFYPFYSGRLIQPAGWSVLNNSGDALKLLDSFNIMAASFDYVSGYGDNFSWSRVESGVDEGIWGRSENSGGSPGELNRVVFSSSGESVRLRIEPSHFSPDGDGYQDTVIIFIESPQAEAYSLKIFDRYGRQIRSILDDELFMASSYGWDGKFDDGRRAPVGIYIVLFEARGERTVKKPVVVAR